MQLQPALRALRTRALRRTKLRGEPLEPRLALTGGTLDPTFGGTGLVSIHPGTAGFVDEGFSVATQADGKVVVAGTAWNSNDKISFSLVRYNEDGSLDTTFGTDGQVITPVTTSIEQGRIYGLIVEPDQKIVVSGEDGSNMEVARYNTDGSLDTTFGTGGIVTVPAIGTNFTDGKGESLAVQADGKYVITGTSTGLQFQHTWPVVRLNHDGSVDTTFGAAGLADGPTFAGSGLPEAWDVIVQQDQKIVVVGDTGALSNQWQVVRYNSDGTLDTTFGANGMATITLTDEGQDAFQVAQQADGKLLITGTPFLDPSESLTGVELVRLNTNGTLDSTFNGGQPIITGIPGNANSESYQVAVQSNGKILLASNAETTAGTGVGNFALQRYNTNGTLDTTFGNAGTALTTFNETFDSWGLDSEDRVGMALEPNGGIVLMSIGQLTLNDPGTSWVLARFTGDPVGKTSPSITVADAGGIYNGGTFPATATVNGGPSLEAVTPTLAYYVGSTTTSTPSSTPPTAAGTYTVVANFAGSADYLAVSSSPATFNISKASPPITVSDAGGTFDGNPFPATASVNGGPSLEGVTPTLTYYVGSTTTSTPSSTPPTAAGTYTVVANFAGSADYSAVSSNPVTFSITQDNLSVAITAVTPSPRNTAVGTMTITFSEPISGFSLSNLQLSQNGGANLLTGSQTLTTSDNTTWTLGNLVSLTSTSGNYVLTLSPTGIRDAASNALASGASSSFVITDPWQNPVNPVDVNGDGALTAIDALDVIDRLNSFGSSKLTGLPGDPPFYYDTNGDGSITAIDALDVINALNAQARPQAVGVDAAAAALGIADQASAVAQNRSLPPGSNNQVGSGAAANSGSAGTGVGVAAAAEPLALAAPASRAEMISSVYAAAVDADWALDDLVSSVTASVADQIRGRK